MDDTHDMGPSTPAPADLHDAAPAVSQISDNVAAQAGDYAPLGSPATHPDELLPPVDTISPEAIGLVPEPSAQQSGPHFTARSVGPNEFRIFEGERAIGRTLTPTEATLVLGWVNSVATADA